MNPKRRRYFPPYRRILLGNVVFQFTVFLFLPCVFPIIDRFLESIVEWLTAYQISFEFADLHISLYSACAYWAGGLLIILRRPRHPTRGDLFYLQYAMPILLLVDFVIFPWVWYLKDR